MCTFQIGLIEFSLNLKSILCIFIMKLQKDVYVTSQLIHEIVLVAYTWHVPCISVYKLDEYYTVISDEKERFYNRTWYGLEDKIL